MKTIAITGSSGFVGTSLLNNFKNSFNIIRIKRDQLKDIEKLKEIVEKSDYIINLAGANIIGRWTESYKKTLYASRINTTQALVEAISQAQSKPELLISTSAVGIYKNLACYSEKDKEYSDDFLSKLCKEWEESALRANDYGVRTTIFRFGIVLGNGGALEKMITPFKLGLGGTIGDGSQKFSFIHIDDLLNAYDFVINNTQKDGVYNLTAPNPTTNLGLTKALGKALNRPTILPVPQFMLNLIFSEGAKVLTDGQCALPKRLLDDGFTFKYDNIDDAIKSLV